jgi:hypothetical protein
MKSSILFNKYEGGGNKSMVVRKKSVASKHPGLLNSQSQSSMSASCVSWNNLNQSKSNSISK